ncbi:hypothetical protein LPJ57_001998 [Coemansia sp. RSA 486]|nr:hypothetical protein LPJ57_001998 [Coemansia sp. RSA 486]KAJ2234666.1 hypothetical protein IWW45_003233 [Coemansia sp. RSA 485]KAJ2636066.1 hypothetical protein GGF40_003235 [Coemansia sp. RSA 1286]
MSAVATNHSSVQSDPNSNYDMPPPACAGVSDDEPTDREEQLALQVKEHPELAGELISHLPTVDPNMSPTVGSYRIHGFSIPSDLPPYKLSDGSKAQERLSQIYQKDMQAGSDRRGHSMVVACSSSLAVYQETEPLDERPICPDEQIVFYVGGGGFSTCDTPVEKWLYVRMSKELGRRVFVSKYQVAPEGRFPQPIHDVYVAFKYLLTRGFEPQNILLFAASAGGNIALALLQILRMQQDSAVEKCVLIAPCVDLTLKSESWIRNQQRCVTKYRTIEDALSFTRMYYGPADMDEVRKMAEHPLMSPIRGTLTGLPQMLVLVGSHDVLVDESRELARRIVDAGGDATYVEYPGKNHYTLLRGKTQLDKIYSQIRHFVSQ